jgi:hypothetical protein
MEGEAGEAIARIGDRELPITGGQFRSAIEQLDQAEFTVEFAEGNDWVEYLAPVKVEVDRHSMFEGQTTMAFPRGNGVEIHAQSAVSLTEERSHGLLIEDCDHRDVVYAMVREAGFDDDHIEIEGLDELQTEVFEVVVGVEGIEVDSSYHVGSITFLSHEKGLGALNHFDADPEWREEFGSASAFALTYLTTARMYQAEQEALGDIEATLSWLTTRTRYGCSHLPDGTLNAYVRSESNATPKRANLVAIRAPMSGRRWLRRLGPRVRAPRCNSTRALVSASRGCLPAWHWGSAKRSFRPSGLCRRKIPFSARRRFGSRLSSTSLVVRQSASLRRASGESS